MSSVLPSLIIYLLIRNSYVIPLCIFNLYPIVEYVWDSNRMNNSFEIDVNGLRAASWQSFLRRNRVLWLEPNTSIQSDLYFPTQFGSKLWIVTRSLCSSFIRILLEQSSYFRPVKVWFAIVSSNPDVGMWLISKLLFPQPVYEKTKQYIKYLM